MIFIITKLMNIGNPFKERQFTASTTFLLNYGEESLTMYRLLSRKNQQTTNRNHLRAELTILDKARKQAYENCTVIPEEDEIQEYCPSLEEGKTSEADSFWKYLPKQKYIKPLINPFLDSSSYAQYGPLGRKGSNSEPLLRESRSVKEMLRRELSSLKGQVRKNVNKVGQDKESILSVTDLYKQKVKPDGKELQTNQAHQISFRSSLDRNKIRSGTGMERSRFQISRKR